MTSALAMHMQGTGEMGGMMGMGTIGMGMILIQLLVVVVLGLLSVHLFKDLFKARRRRDVAEAALSHDTATAPAPGTHDAS